MLDYELAKSLKDAGFPQKVEPGHGYYHPTLEELIEACGSEFGSIIRYDDGTFEVQSRGGWGSYTDKSLPIAVARLWLALNPEKSMKK